MPDGEAQSGTAARRILREEEKQWFYCFPAGHLHAGQFLSRDRSLHADENIIVHPPCYLCSRGDVLLRLPAVKKRAIIYTKMGAYAPVVDI